MLLVACMWLRLERLLSITLGDGETWEGVDRWHQLANKSTSRTLSSLKITSSRFFLTTVSTQTLEGRDCCRSFAERLPRNSKCKMKKKTSILVAWFVRLVLILSCTFLRNLIKKGEYNRNARHLFHLTFVSAPNDAGRLKISTLLLVHKLRTQTNTCWKVVLTLRARNWRRNPRRTPEPLRWKNGQCQWR